MRVLTMGEIMLRLSPPDYKKAAVSDVFEACYGGSEANIAISLSNMGIDTGFFTVVPDQAIGKCAVRTLKSNGVDCSRVIYASQQDAPSFRLGLYFLEIGYGVRPSQVVYDRAHSAIAEYDYSNTDLDAVLADYDWLHVSGITAALSENCRKLVLDCMKRAKERNMTVSFDGNYRSRLWSWEEARKCCTEYLPYVDILFGIEPYDLPDANGKDIKDKIPFHPSREQQEAIFAAFTERYPNLKSIVRHERFAVSGSVNQLRAYLWEDGKMIESPLYQFDVLDRVGGGDALASGFIYAKIRGFEPEKAIRFAVASSILKHTMHGDASLIDNENEIFQVMESNFDIQR